MKPILQSLLCCVGMFVGGFAALGVLSPPQSSRAEEALVQLLKLQAEEWNRGDLEAFMQGYWRSPALTFAGARGIERGWDGVLARYKRVYPDRTAMGHLTFSGLEITPLGEDAALVLGRWQIQRDRDQPSGVFSLVLRRFPDGWRIIHDHTSAVASQQK